MTIRAIIVSALDILTRPLLVLAYLLAAKWSVGFVRRRRGQLDIAPANEDEDAATIFPPYEFPPAEISEWPPVSVVIPVLNAEKVLARCLESLQALDYPRDRVEIIVADNGSSDRSLEIAKDFGAKVVRQPKRGAAAARNAGIAAARSPWIALTDADCVVHPQWLKQLATTALREKSAAVGGRVIPVCADPVAREFCAREGVPDQQASIEGRMLPFPFIDTSSGLFRRDALEAVGGFDEEFGDAAAEDVDLGWRLHARGWAIRYAADAWIAHRQRERDVDVHAQFYRYGLSEVNLYLKHRDRFTRRELSRHLWIRPILYRHFWKALVKWIVSRHPDERRFWRLVVFKELGHMAGKMEGARRWKTGQYFRLWTRE